MQSVRPYRIVRRIQVVGNEFGYFPEIWRTWDVIRLAERTVRMSLQGRSSDVTGPVVAGDLGLWLPEDDDGGFIVAIAPA
jgi:hypothetical protein